jgi:hypothetical protein
MSGTRAHTDSEKARAIGIALVSGTEVAAKSAGVSRRSVQRWVDDPAMSRLVAEKRETVGSHLWAGMQVALESVVAGLKDPDAPLQARATTFGILFDKWALMSGEATARTETKDVTVDLPDDIRRDLRDRFSDRLRTPDEGVEAEGAQGAATPAG